MAIQSTPAPDLPVEQAQNFELLLLSLRYKVGRPVRVEGNQPIWLDDPARVWVVNRGTVFVFAVPRSSDGKSGPRRHLFQGGAGQLLFGVPADQTGLLVTGAAGTQLLEMPRAYLLELAAELEYGELLGRMLDQWVTRLYGGIVEGVPPKEAHLLEPGFALDLKPQEAAVAYQGVVWAQVTAGRALWLDRPQLAQTAATPLPVARPVWLRAATPVRVQVTNTADLIQSQAAGPALDMFNQLVLQLIDLEVGEAAEAERARLGARVSQEQQVTNQSLRRLATPLQPASSAAVGQVLDLGGSDLLSACRLVGQAMGVEMQADWRADQARSVEQAMREIARASRLRLREVGLTGRWWRQESGPLLGFLADEHRPVALLPRSATAYDLADVKTGQVIRVSDKVALRLEALGYMFYRPLPGRVLGGWDVARFGLEGIRRDLNAFLLLGMLLAVFGLLPPIAVGIMFDYVIPGGYQSGLLQIGGALLLLALASAALQLARGVALLRVQSKIDAHVQAAVWDRLLGLPIDFFARYTSGDLGTRAMGLTEIRQTLSGPILTILFNCLFSVVNLILLFFYSPTLAVVAVVMALAAVAVTVATSTVYLRAQRQLQTVQGKAAGVVLQLLTGISKFRLAGAEHQAFSIWSEVFVAQQRLYFQAQRAVNQLNALNAAFPVLAAAIIFGAVALFPQPGLSTGSFLAFYLAFVQFLTAWIVLGSTLVYMLNAVPTFERLRPILETAPETDLAKSDPGELAGEIEVSNLSFRYRPGSPLALQGVNVHVQPGEFVALVGPSGSGKSTLLRLLLGFARPESGGIYYDDQDLADLDVQAVRRQVGVVLQSATLMSGDIFSNVIGSSPDLTSEDAWEALRLAGLEQDVKDMPMGLYTLVSERGMNLSGGQRQRLMIARALIHRPRILFFDEATSALDNRTQAIVSESLQSLQATRLVIAHRLSTIVKANRIYVFQNSRIVQTGSYAELLDQPGLFADLARRQLM